MSDWITQLLHRLKAAVWRLTHLSRKLPEYEESEAGKRYRQDWEEGWRRRQEEHPDDIPMYYWESKPCPSCERLVNLDSKACYYCGHTFDEGEATTRDEFEQSYAERSGLTIDELHGMDLYAVPCNCGEDGCKGWQMRNLTILLLPGTRPETEHVPSDWDGEDLLTALVADGRTELVAALRAWLGKSGRAGKG